MFGSRDADPVNVSVIVVNFNCAAHVEACVGSLRRECGRDLEVIVVDNASSERDRDLLQLALAGLDCRIILAPENRGFAAGCNIGARAARSRWLHFLNPDCTVGPGALAAYESLERAPGAAIFTTRLKTGDGADRRNVYAVPRFGNLVMACLGREAAYWAQGSSILITAADLNALGNWDEGYFMYAEDLDLCYAAYRHGLPLRTLDMEVVHVGGASASQVWNSLERERRVFRGYRRFFEKHASLLEYACVMPMLIAWNAIKDRKSPLPALRMFLASLQDRSL